MLPSHQLKAVVNRIEALKWDKGQLYEKVQGTLAVLDIFRAARDVTAREKNQSALDEIYQSKITEIDMDYVTSCGNWHSPNTNQNMHPIDLVLNTISRIQRGKSSLAQLSEQLIRGWPCVYDLIVDGLAMASANRISQMFDATIKGSIGVNNLMVLLRSERAMLNELQADMMGLLSWNELNEKISVACSNQSGAAELQEAAAATRTALENAKVEGAKARAALDELRNLKRVGEEFIASRNFDPSSQVCQC